MTAIIDPSLSVIIDSAADYVLIRIKLEPPQLPFHLGLFRMPSHSPFHLGLFRMILAAPRLTGPMDSAICYQYSIAPQYTQSVSNLQHDYGVAAKNTIQNMVLAQKTPGTNMSFPTVTPEYIDEFVKRSNEFTDNTVNALRINNQLTVNAINAAAENFRIFNRFCDRI